MATNPGSILDTIMNFPSTSLVFCNNELVSYENEAVTCDYLQ